MTRMSRALDRQLYVPVPAEVEASRELTVTERLLKLRRADGRVLGHKPGQFVQVNLFGIGEAPISVSNAQKPGDPTFELCVRRIGRLTTAFHELKPGSTVGIRGPYGRGFQTEAMTGKDVLFVAGGIGMAPLRSLVQHCAGATEDFGRLTLLYGSGQPSEILFTEELAAWPKQGIDVRLTIDREHPDWDGHVGLITTLLEPLELDGERTVAAVCGPPIMYRFVLSILREKGVPDHQVQLSLERRMRCGVGKCGHCAIGDYCCCTDGPVFTYDQIRDVQGAL